MAPTDTTAAMLAGMFGGLNGGGRGAAVDDVLNFQKTLSANDIYGQLAPAVYGAKFDTSTWSPGTTLGVTAGQAFLGAALKAIGERNQGEQLAKVATVLPQLYSNPQSVAVPEGVDPEAFGGLKLAAMSRGAASQANQLDKLMEQIFTSKLAGTTEREKKLGELGAEKDFYNASGTANPENPLEKKVVELRNDFDKREEVQNFKYVQRLSNQLVNTLKNPDAVADPILAKMVIQFVEPRMAVNAGEAAGLAASSSIPEGWKANIAKAMTGESALSPDVRRGLLNIASSAYDAHSKAYSQIFNQFQAEAQRYNIPIERISSVGVPQGFNTIAQSKNSPLENANGVDEATLRREAATIKQNNPNATPSQIAAFLREKHGGAPHG